MRVFCRFAVLLCILSPSQALAAPEVLPLDADQLRGAQLESVPPFPAELVLAGKSEHWQSIVHQGEVVVAIYAAAPALLDISSPFPYDEFVLVLDGEVTLTHVDGDKATYKAGDTFLVPKGFMGTWEMRGDYRELIVVDTDAWLGTEGN